MDRFIPNRKGIDLEVSYYLLNKSSSPPFEFQIREAKYINYASLKWNHRKYKNCLKNTLGPQAKKVLNFSESSTKKGATENYKMPPWPVKRRRKPQIGSPVAILDMPDLEANIGHHMADWSNKDYLASIFEGEVYVWHPEIKQPRALTHTNGQVEHTIRWSTSGTNLAMAKKRHNLAIVDGFAEKIVSQSICGCLKSCSITSITWSSLNILITGCTRGGLTKYTPNLQRLKSIEYAHSGDIITIALSCNEHYLGTSAIDEHVRIWSWPSLEPIMEIDNRSLVRGLAWHPWRDPLFAIGGSVQNSILSLWKANTSQCVGYKQTMNCFIDDLTFNPITGELVVSCCPENKISASIILVMADFEKEVDAIKWHHDRVLYLLWNKDGTRLGTAGADENFCIWDFFGNQLNRCKLWTLPTKQKSFSLKPQDNLNLFGQCIR